MRANCALDMGISACYNSSDAYIIKYADRMVAGMADFFHPEDKERYLAQAKWAAPYSRVIFLRSSELEYTLNMDLATMDKAEIVSVLNSFDLLAFETIQGLISAIRHYLGWYRQNIDVGTNNVDDIYIVKEDLDIVGSMKRNLFTNWNHFGNGEI